MPAEYDKGFHALHKETVLDEVPIAGEMPAWLQGTLLRNGPGRFDVGDQRYNHWFDGLAMLHRFTVADGRVSYANRYLHSQDYTASITDGAINMRAFATDPCMSLFQRFMSVFDTNMTDNGNINVVRWADKFIALTESPFAVEFDPSTLETTAHRDFSDHVLQRSATTAHPHTVDGTIYNFAVRFDFPTSAYRIYTYDPATETRRIVGQVPVRRPSYIHSFGVSANYAIIAAYPLTVSVPDLAFSGKAFIENYRWATENPVRFYLLRLSDGERVGTFETDAFFAFHHINAHEDGDHVVVDLIAYPDDRAVQGLYLNRVREGDRSIVPAGEARRYRLNTANGSLVWEPLSEVAVELPRINDAYNTRPYRYAYAISADAKTHVGFPNQLAKIDIETGETTTWRKANAYPGEAVFVPNPDGSAEDDGVLLSVVLDVAHEHSYLLVLDAANMTEVARATVPHHIPFGFHGQFYDET